MPEQKRIFPKRQQVYTLDEIENVLYLRDSPSLVVSGIGVIQTSHLSNDEFLSIPGIRDTKWRYVRETNEWIPIFRSVELEDNFNLIKSCIDYEEWITKWADSDNESDDGKLYWVTPKGFPRNQND